MIQWRAAFERLRESQEFREYFAAGRNIKMSDFRPIVYCQRFDDVPAATVTGGATPTSSFTPGAPQGPTLQNFPSGGIVLGITAAAAQPQTTTSAFTYAPSFTAGRRDQFALSFKYTNDEEITPGGPCLADALLGGGDENIFPIREIVIRPSQGLLATVESYQVDPPQNVHICYHTMIPKVAS